MPTITFSPVNLICEIEEGTLLQTAAEQAGVMLSFPCACKGVCGKCLVKVEKGEVAYENNGALSEELCGQGFVLACKASVTGCDAEIYVPSSLSEEQGQFSDALSRIGIDAALFPSKDDLKPLTVCKKILVARPEILDGLGDYDRFAMSVRQSLAVDSIELPLDLLRRLPDILRQNGGEIVIWYSMRGNIAHIVDISAEDETISYGMAVDIGTTTVALQLVDITAGRVIDTITVYNAQISRGEDVISRISYAKTPERIQEMKELVLSTINQGITRLCEENGGISPRLIRNVSIAANTTMTQLFMGIKPEYIRLEPYTPAIMEAPLYTARELGLGTNPNAFVWIAPNVGSYVGGDITSGLICTDLAFDTEEICLFIDIGTNGEIVLGNSEFLMGCACSAGPAFEGGGIEKGMRASLGAIERVDIDPLTGECTCSVIGGGEPKGICGSGLISLTARLLEAGIIDQRGKLDRSGRFPSIIAEGKNARYVVVPPKDSGSGVYLSENDIDNFIRAKAAIFSACVTMLGSVGLDFDSIGKIYIAGGFGRYIDIQNAQTLGLMPCLEEDRFLYIGNSSLTGAFMSLLSEKHRKKVLELAKRVTYVDLSTEADYMDEYVAAMFLPHTDMRLFEKKK